MDRIEAKLDGLIRSRKIDLSYEAIILIIILALITGIWSIYIFSKIYDEDEDDGLWLIIIMTIIAVIISIYILRRERMGI